MPVFTGTVTTFKCSHFKRLLMDTQANNASTGLIQHRARAEDLPAELLCAIFDYVEWAFYETADIYHASTHGRRYTANEIALKRCFASFALVCRHWCATVKPYLNRTLAIVFSPQDESYNSFASVMTWLDLNPIFPASVRNLRLIMTDCIDWDDLIVQDGFDPSTLFRLLHLLPRLQNLDLVDIRFNDGNPEDPLAGARHVLKLQSPLLDLNRVGIYHTEACSPIPADVTQILSCIRTVGEVYIDTNPQLDWLVGNDPDGGPITVPQRLETSSLIIKSLDLPLRLLRAFTGTRAITNGTLRKLHMQVDVFTIPNLAALLVPAAPSVTELCLDFSLYPIRTPQIFTLLLNNSLPIGSFHHLEQLDLIFPLPSFYHARVYLGILEVLTIELHGLTQLRRFSITVLDDEEHADEDIETRLDTCCEFLVLPLKEIADALTPLEALTSFTVACKDHTGRKREFRGANRARMEIALGPLVNQITVNM